MDLVSVFKNFVSENFVGKPSRLPVSRGHRGYIPRHVFGCVSKRFLGGGDKVRESLCMGDAKRRRAPTEPEIIEYAELNTQCGLFRLLYEALRCVHGFGSSVDERIQSAIPAPGALSLWHFGYLMDGTPDGWNTYSSRDIS
jgi:hypothetical protein